MPRSRKPAPGGFLPPDEAARVAAVGRLQSAEDSAVFNPRSKAFLPMPAPREDDWLWDRAGQGQTFNRWLHSGANIPAPPSKRQQPGDFARRADAARNVIYLLPLGDFDPDASPRFDDLARWCAAFYHGLQVRVLDALPSSSGAFRAIGRRALDADDGASKEQCQLKIADIDKLLRRRLPRDAYCVAALTMYDLYAGGYNFLFGRASMKERVGVFSFARYDPRFWGEAREAGYRHELLWRSCNVMAHEIGHMFNFSHCVYYHCRMNGANSLEEAGRRPPDICPCCLRKLHHAVRFDCAARYAALAACARGFVDAHGDGRFAADGAWFEARVREVAPPRRAEALLADAAAAAAAAAGPTAAATGTGEAGSGDDAGGDDDAPSSASSSAPPALSRTLSGSCSRGLRDDDDDDAVEEGDDGDSERASDAALDVGDANGMLRLLARASVEAGIDARSATRLFLEADAVLTAARRTRAVSSKVLTDGGAKVVTIAPGPFAVAAPPDEPLPVP